MPAHLGPHGLAEAFVGEPKTASIAFVRDWLTVYAGADRVMEAALDIFSSASIYALIYQREHFAGRALAGRPVRTSFIDRLPGGRRWHRAYLPLMPFAIEQFDLRAHDIVISFSHAVAKGVLTRENQLHISYILTPMRYAWDLYFDSLKASRVERGLRSWLARPALHYLRLWDAQTGDRPDVMVAASEYVARRIRKIYRRDAAVLYPPVDVDRFNPHVERDDFYLTVSRLVPYKRVDLVVEAFTRSNRPLLVIGTGPELGRLRRLAGPCVRFLGEQPDEAVKDYLERCRAFVYAADEDFGIAPVEAQAAGAPVIAYGHGGNLETVIPGVTGLLFSTQQSGAIIEAVERFEQGRLTFHPLRVREHVERFSRQNFTREFKTLVEREWDRFVGARGRANFENGRAHGLRR